MTRSFQIVDFDECFNAVSGKATMDVLDRAAVLSVASGSERNFPAAQFSTMAGESLMFGHMGFIPGVGMAVKTGMQVPGNRSVGLDTVQGSVLLFDADTGVPQALVDGRAITVMRTAGALVAGIREVLNQQEIRREPIAPLKVAVIGYGAQGRQVAKLAREVLNVEMISVFNRSKLTSAEGVEQADSVTEAVEGADIIACATSSLEPVLSIDDVCAARRTSRSGGVVVASLNSYQPNTSELDPRIIDASNTIHLDIDDPLKFGPVSNSKFGRRNAGDFDSETAPTVMLLGQRVSEKFGDQSASFAESAVRTVLIGGHGLQDALLAWSVTMGWPTIEASTRGYTGSDDSGIAR